MKCIVLALAALFAGIGAQAQVAYPSRLVTIVYPYPLAAPATSRCGNSWVICNQRWDNHSSWSDAPARLA